MKIRNSKNICRRAAYRLSTIVHRLSQPFITVVFLCLCVVPAVAQPVFDTVQLLKDVEVLSADSLGGRETGTAGSLKAQAYIKAAFKHIGLRALGDSYERPFLVNNGQRGITQGVNLVSWLPGAARPDTFLVITAHFDHLGMGDGAIYNGADDNASGVAGLLAAADYFVQHPPLHSMLFVALDSEEMGLLGAYSIVQDPPVPLDHIALNVNLDMISRNEYGELYASGITPYPFLKPYLEAAASRSAISLVFGHDGGDPVEADWTMSSDHGPFHQAGIPFVYFGVEDHSDYHRVSDEFDQIEPSFFINSVSTIIDALQELDANLAAICNQTP